MKLRPPSPAMVIALLALFVALGGTGYAAYVAGAGAASSTIDFALAVFC